MYRVKRKQLSSVTTKYRQSLLRNDISVINDVSDEIVRKKVNRESYQSCSYLTTNDETGEGMSLVFEHEYVDNIQETKENFSNNDSTDEEDMNVLSEKINRNETNKVSLFEAWASWALKYNIPQNAINASLQILKEHHCYHGDQCLLPKDARTLLKTPGSIAIREVPPGEYHHFGLTKGLTKIISDGHFTGDVIDLYVFVDGLPISKSSNKCFWPILACTSVSSEIFIIGCYCGEEKPKSANDFLKEFTDEAEDLITNGISNNSRKIEVHLKGLICDAPAKAFVLRTKSHTGYYSCSKCTIEGEYYKNRVVFSGCPGALRTDVGFAANVYEDYQLGETILKRIPGIKLVSGVPLDYMHLICLGVTRKIIQLWLGGPVGVRLPSKSVLEVNEKLIQLAPFVPQEFQRKPRSLSHVGQWKASELRQFLLYSGPVLLKNILQEELYLNFMTLSVAVSILVNPNLLPTLKSYAAALLEHFVKCFTIIYGKENVTHNVHGLLHITSDTNIHGPLDHFSAFRFESFMYGLKKLIRKAEKPLQQLAKRYQEKLAIENEESQCEQAKNTTVFFPHKKGPITATCNPKCQYHGIRYEASGCEIKLKCTGKADTFIVLKNGGFVEIVNISFCEILKKNVLIGRSLIELETFYEAPCSSNLLGIAVVKRGESELRCWTIEDVKSKIFLIPYNNFYVALPLIHQFRM